MDDRPPPIWFIFSVTVVGILANTLITPNIPDVLSDLGQPKGRAGLLVAVSPLPGVLVAPLIGVLADRLGRRRVLLPCLFLFGVAGAGAAIAPTFDLLLLARLLQGFGSAGLINLAIVLIGDHWSGEERTRLVGRNAAVLTLCLALVPALSGVLAELTHWRVALALSAIGIPVGVIGLRVLPAIRPQITRTVRQQVTQTAAIVRQPAVLIVVGSGFLLFVVIFGVFLTTLPVHLEEEFGLGPGARGLVLSTPAIGSTIAAFNLGLVRRRFSLRAVLVASSLLIAIAAGGIGLAGSVALVVVASVIYGLGDGSTIPALQDTATALAPTDQRASVMAAWVALVRLGQATGPLMAAWIFEATSTRTTMLLGAAVFAGVAVLFAVGPVNDPNTDNPAPQ